MSYQCFLLFLFLLFSLLLILHNSVIFCGQDLCLYSIFTCFCLFCHFNTFKWFDTPSATIHPFPWVSLQVFFDSLLIQINPMSSINLLNPKAEYMKKQQAMAVQLTAATGMQEVLKTNLGNCYFSIMVTIQVPKVH